MVPPIVPGSMELNAVTAAAPFEAKASSPPAVSSTPDSSTIIDVIVHMIIVSKKTSKIPHTACSQGSFVSDAACAIGAEPRPASFENTPLAKPWRIAIIMAYPNTPPPTASKLNAPLKMEANTAGTSVMRIIIAAIPANM